METFLPVCSSFDGMLGKVYLVILENLIQLMVVKKYEPILHVCGWINCRI